MNTFASYLAGELPKIETCLHDHVATLNPYVKPMAEHVLQAGGKRLRPVLTLLCARALGYSGGDPYPLACSLEVLHSATLLHDDVLDGSELRRGRPAAHTLFGVGQSILAGDALLALANVMIASYNVPPLMVCLSQAILNTASGEVQEIARVRDVTMDMQGYLDIITGKTACLIQSACEAGALLAGASPELVKAAADFGMNIGIAFQLVDDALDYSSPKEVSGKPKGADIREGKLTLPLIFYLESLDDAGRERFTKAFKENTLQESELESTLVAINAGGFVERTRDMAASYIQDAGRCLAAFPTTPETSLLYAALEGMAKRDK
ncbi:polyprenyl synthetase family protein [Fundidesulfovibrio agrisoli]|uniref:polyprenyl synthetase family protein n=1 Tax=Fundidesulfovibrio agrisoli TaxID=2922717 RepID=UPI001FAC155A|nr:polyprenyl synthetase family protein [Fundidesulfovibrio agrisoli]